MHLTRTSRAASLLAALSLAGAGLLAVAPAGTAANSVADTHNLVTNSNFANPAVSGLFATYSGGDSTSIPGWSVGLNSVDLNSPAYLSTPAGDPTATQSIDLSGNLAEGSVTQTLHTQAGVHYTGSFELAGNVTCGPTLKSGSLTVGSLNLPFTFDSTGKTSTDMGWTQVNFSFVASSANTPMTFAATDADAGCGAVVTDVIVDAPLPPTIATNPNIQVLQTTAAGTPVTFSSPAASDPNTGSSLTSTCTPASGTTFPAGTTTVTCKTTEPEGLSATSTFSVKVSRVVGSCEARALGFDGSKSVSIDQSNPATSPCAAKSGTLLTASSTLSPGLLGIGSIKASGTLLQSFTTNAVSATSATTGASDKIAAFSFGAPGITVKTTTITSQASATLNASCVGTSTGSSSIEGLVINGKHYTIGSAPLTIPLGLGLELNLNQHIVAGNVVTQRALSITSTHPNAAAYHTVIGETVAGLSCS